jgi:hypothetical protein
MGLGPQRAVFRKGVQIILEMPIWGRRGDHFHPVLFPLNSSPRKKHFWVAGTWSALHMLHLGLAPDPITPWWFYAAVYGENGLPENLAYIRALDPTSATVLEPWFTFTHSDILGNDAGSPIRQLLIVYLELNDVRSSAPPSLS